MRVRTSYGLKENPGVTQALEVLPEDFIARSSIENVREALIREALRYSYMYTSTMVNVNEADVERLWVEIRRLRREKGLYNGELCDAHTYGA